MAHALAERDWTALYNLGHGAVDGMAVVRAKAVHATVRRNIAACYRQAC